MSGQAAVAPANIDSVFASNANEVYADQPFFGAIFRVGPNGEEVWLQHAPQKEKLSLSKFLSQKNISQGRFLIKQQAEGGIKKIPFVVNKNADSEMINPFLANMPPANAAPAGETDKTIENSLKAEMQRLETKLQREEDKRREAEDDLSRLKRDGAGDSTEQAIAHQKEINQLEKQHAKEKAALKEELSELKMDLKLKELESRQNGDQSTWKMVIDKFLDDDVLSNVAGQVGKMMQQQGNAQPTARQIQAAARQQMQPQPNSGPKPHQPRKNPPADDASDDNPDFTTNTGYTPPQAENDTANEPAGNTQAIDPSQINETQKAHMKEQFVNGIKNAALDALTAETGQFQTYANAVRQQMAINKQAGIQLDARQWIELAKMLANKAVQQEIEPARVAKVIRPVLGAVPAKFRFALNMIDAEAAANQLFNQFNIDASPQVKTVVVEVLDVLKNSK